MDWLSAALKWYIMLLFIGIVFFPITKKIFGSFFDKGYPFAKTLGILLLSYAMFAGGNFKLLSFTQPNLILLLLIFGLINLVIATRKNHPSSIIHHLSSPMMIVFEELLFFASFLFLTYIRGQEPSIHGLEKFMDFGFINSILRAQYFPPLDIWLSGFNINYYYFGHLTGAALIKLINIKSSIGYNLILATIFAQGITSAFSLSLNIIHIAYKKIKFVHLLLVGIIGSFIINLGGNLHTIYLFTTGYSNDQPIPFWEILSGFNPIKYWYPNATRFIPFTIHEFPSYSYVVADLHGHVFDIPFVLLTISVLLVTFIQHKKRSSQLSTFCSLLFTISLGFLTAIHYMTNAFDGPIYLLLTIIIFSMVFPFKKILIQSGLLILFFFLFAFPFTKNFSPFVSGIGVNCSPDFLTKIGKIGPFLFEKGNCQISPLWMFFVLWGFFWINFTVFLFLRWKLSTINHQLSTVHSFIFLLFSFSTLLIFIPEFFYIKDIYPAHFRANTMFKLGYQAFIMMSLASSFVLYQIKLFKETVQKFFFQGVFSIIFFFIFLYPFFSFPSYYGTLKKTPQLDGEEWLKTNSPEDKEIISYLNTTIKGQPVILEAQGDSYTDFERISAFTGLPTVAGWWVHEWLWRGSSQAVGSRIPDIVTLYESQDINSTRQLIKKYNIRYVIVSRLEKEKYKNLFREKFDQIGKRVFQSTNNRGIVYQINKDEVIDKVKKM